MKINRIDYKHITKDNKIKLADNLLFLWINGFIYPPEVLIIEDNTWIVGVDWNGKWDGTNHVIGYYYEN